MRVIVAGAAALLFWAVSAQGSEPREDKIICKRSYQADTGSHFQSAKRICLKQSEWKELEDGTEQTMQRIKDRGSRNDPPVTMGSSPN